MSLQILTGLMLLVATSNVALAQGGARAMTKQDFFACEYAFSKWQQDQVESTQNRIESLRAQGGGREELEKAERYLAAARTQSPLDFWWGNAASDLAQSLSRDLAATEQQIRREKETKEDARRSGMLCMYEIRAEFLRTGKIRTYTAGRYLARPELMPCNPQFERLKEATVRMFSPEVERLRMKGADPKKFPLYAAERRLTAAKSLSALDHWWELGGHGYTSMGLSGLEIRVALHHARESLAVSKSGDEARMRAYIGVVPTALDLEQRIASGEASVCALELRQRFLQGGAETAPAGFHEAKTAGTLQHFSGKVTLTGEYRFSLIKQDYMFHKVCLYAQTGYDFPLPTGWVCLRNTKEAMAMLKIPENLGAKNCFFGGQATVEVGSYVNDMSQAGSSRGSNGTLLRVLNFKQSGVSRQSC